MSRKRKRLRLPPHSLSGLEALERRQLLTVSAPPPADELEVENRDSAAFADMYILKMPQLNAATAQGLADYQSLAPDVPAGWAVDSIGFGYYSLTAPGTSITEVSAWAATEGVVSVEPDGVLEKQNYPLYSFATPFYANDDWFGQYQWGLNNTGDTRATTSPESQAAAELGNSQNNGNIFPRWPIGSGRTDQYGNLLNDADIDAPEAWYRQTGSREIIVAVMDDGIDHDHPDLVTNMWVRPDLPGIEEVAGLHGFNSAHRAQLPNDVMALEDGRVRLDGVWYPVEDLVATQPGNVALGAFLQEYYNEQLRRPGANDAHGTHVAGIIGADGNNSAGVAGVNWNVSLYSANIFRFGDYVEQTREDGQAGQEDQYRWVGAGGVGAVSAFVDAANRLIRLKRDFGQNIAVVNCSFNTYTFHQAMRDAIQALGDAGILVVTAAGNGYDPCKADGVGDRYTGEPCEWVPAYPGAWSGELTNIINVGASTADDKLTRFSNWGPGVDIAAPGENIWSTVPIAARRYEPGIPGVGTDIPLRYDSREPFEPLPDFDLHPPPISPLGGFGGITRMTDTVVRPLMYRQVPQAMIEYSRGSGLGREGAFAGMSGTSMSAAYVSGVAALVAAEYFENVRLLPEVEFLKRAILQGADQIETLRYQERIPGFPSFDYQTRQPISALVDDPNNDIDVERPPVQWSGMYTERDDPTGPGRPLVEHFIRSLADFLNENERNDLRLNANGAIQWCIDHLPPRVTITSPSDASRLEGDSGITEFLFTFALSPSRFGPREITEDLQVSYWTEAIPNAALPGIDFLPLVQGAQTFRIDAGTAMNDPQRISLQIIVGDLLAEPNEQFRLRFAMVPTRQAYIGLGEQVTTIIRNDDPSDAEPAVTLDATPLVIQEGGQDWLDIVVSADRAPSRSILVPYSITSNIPLEFRDQFDRDGLETAIPDQDFIAQNGTLTFAQGQRSTTIRVRLNDNTVVDDASSRSLFVRLLEQPSRGVLKRDRNIKIITIEDNDAAPPPPPPQPGGRTLRITGPAAPIVEGSAADFEFSLDQPVASGWALSVVYSTESGTASAGLDFPAIQSGKLVIPAGETSGRISIPLTADRFNELDETFRVRIIDARYRRLGSTEEEAVTLAGGGVASATIADGTAPLESRTAQLFGPGDVPEGTPAVFTIQLDQPVANGWAFTVLYAVEEGTARAGSDYSSAGTGRIVLTAGQSIGQISIPTTADRLAEEDETFQLRVVRYAYERISPQETGVAGDPGLPVQAVIADRSLQLIEGQGNVALSYDGVGRLYANQIAITRDGGPLNYFAVSGTGLLPMAAENQDGVNRLVLRHYLGDLHVWRMDSSWAFVSELTTIEQNSPAFRAAETAYGVDFDGDGVVGAGVTLIESVGNVSLGYDGVNNLVANGIRITYAGSPVALDDPSNAGWSFLAADVENGVNTVVLRHSSGRLWFWRMDASWAHVSGDGWLAPNSAGFNAAELSFGMDFNDDGVIGAALTTVESVGSVTLAYDQTRDLYANGTRISFGGLPVTYASGSGGTWRILAADVDNGVNTVVLRHSTGRLWFWRMDASWRHRSGDGWFLPNSPGYVAAELSFGMDFSGDGVVGSGLTAIETVGSVVLSYDRANRLYANGTPLAYNGRPVSYSTSPSEPWRFLAADVDNGVNTVVLRHSTGRLWFWRMDASWSQRSGDGWFLPNSPGYVAAELSFGMDFNEDGIVGSGLTAIESVGNVSLASDRANDLYANGTRLSDKDGNTVRNTSADAIWRFLAAERVDGVNTLALRHSTGNLWFWRMDASWRQISGYGWYAPLSPQYNAAERSFGMDFNGDGRIGG